MTQIRRHSRSRLKFAIELVFLLLICACSVLGEDAPIQQELIREVQIHGQRRIPADTIRARLTIHAGDVYDQNTLERDFSSVWNTGYFDDLRFEREQGPKGWILHVYVKEKPNIREVTYVGMNSVSVSDVLERFKQRKISLSVESQYDPTKVKKAELVLKELLAERGRQFATVRTEIRQIPPASVGIKFDIKEGPKVKVGRIRFEGNKKVGAKYLRASMKNLRPIGIPHSKFLEALFDKTYDATKLSEDAERVRMAYQQRGYFKAIVQDPKTTMRDYSPGLIHVPVFQKPGKRVDITMPVEEGDRYTLKAITFSGNKAIANEAFLRNLFPIHDGDIFNSDLIRKGLENMRKAYGELGHINFTSVPNTDVDDDKKQVSLKIDADEGKPFYVRRIEFVGNTTTRDKVIRRELALEEGSVYNSRLWELSLLRLNQLGYFEPLKAEGPDAEQSTDIRQNAQEATIDLTLRVKEKGKNSIGLTGGASGQSGTFIGLSYETNNFLGLGTTLSFSAQAGSLQRNFSFGVTQPYTFNRATTTGFTVYSSQYRYDQSKQLSIQTGQSVSLNPATEQNYKQDVTGFTVFANHPLRRSFLRLGISYSYSVTNLTAFTNAAQVLFQTSDYSSLAGPSAIRGIRSSGITPSITYNSVDNPMNPTHGKSLSYSANLQGLGGNVKSITQVFEGKYFRPMNHRRNVLALRLQTAFATGYGGLSVPTNDRFYTGGDDSVRGFEARTISPIAFVPVATKTAAMFRDPQNLDSTGGAVWRDLTIPILSYTIVYPGGDTQALANAEYRIPLAGPVTMAVFFDAGVNGILLRDQLKLNQSGLDQLRAQFPNATITDKLQLLPGTNFRPRTSTGVEFVVQLPIIQAPFRVYWAYNPTRYYQTVTAPASSYYLNDQILGSLPPNVYNQIIVPGLSYQLKDPQEVIFHEKRSTFRFTVSRTF